eukprot:767866-Hanusia_phi.AAC.2
MVHHVRGVDRRPVGEDLREHMEVLRMQAEVKVARHLLRIESAVDVAALPPLELLSDVRDRQRVSRELHLF